MGWYDPDWWVGSNEEQARLEGIYEGCSREARHELIKYSLAPLSGYHNTDTAEHTDTGTVSTAVPAPVLNACTHIRMWVEPFLTGEGGFRRLLAGEQAG